MVRVGRREPCVELAAFLEANISALVHVAVFPGMSYLLAQFCEAPGYQWVDPALPELLTQCVAGMLMYECTVPSCDAGHFSVAFTEYDRSPLSGPPPVVRLTDRVCSTCWDTLKQRSLRHKVCDWCRGSYCCVCGFQSRPMSDTCSFCVWMGIMSRDITEHDLYPLDIGLALELAWDVMCGYNQTCE